MHICTREPLWILKTFIVLHTLSACNSLLVRCKVYLSDPRVCLCTSWTYAEAYEAFSIEPASSQKSPIKKQNCQPLLLGEVYTEINLNLILTNPELFIIYWTGHHLFWFRFLKLLLIFYCQSSWQEISILKK